MDVAWQGETAVVTLDRQPVNALTDEVVAELRATFETLTASPPRGMVLSGRGKAFCAGVDVREIPAYSAERRLAMAAGINEMVRLLYTLPTATVAAVNGHALGAGLVLTLACDARLVVDADARLGLPEVTAGVSYPDGPMVVIESELEPTTRRRLVLSGRTLTPHEAATLDIVDEVVASDRLLDLAVQRAHDLAGAPGYRAVKAQLRSTAAERLSSISANAPSASGLST